MTPNDAKRRRRCPEDREPEVPSRCSFRADPTHYYAPALPFLGQIRPESEKKIADRFRGASPGLGSGAQGAASTKKGWTIVTSHGISAENPRTPWRGLTLRVHRASSGTVPVLA